LRTPANDDGGSEKGRTRMRQFVEIFGNNNRNLCGAPWRAALAQRLQMLPAKSAGEGTLGACLDT
jgi:hypothetical protein